MTIDPLKQARAELSSAHKSIAAMKSAKTMDDFEAEWRVFLNCLEKLWTKLERSCQPFKNAFQPWQGKFAAQRKDDPLLRYLKAARHADNHSIQDVTRLNPGSQALRFANPRGGFIKHMRIQNGQVVSYEGDPMIAEITLPHPSAVRVMNSGEWFEPPTSHLGVNVATSHPTELAELGLKFYSGFFQEVKQKFFAD